MGREYSTRVKIAGVNVLFKSDMEIDICNLCGPRGIVRGGRMPLPNQRT